MIKLTVWSHLVYDIMEQTTVSLNGYDIHLTMPSG